MLPALLWIREQQAATLCKKDTSSASLVAILSVQAIACTIWAVECKSLILSSHDESIRLFDMVGRYRGD